MYVIYYNKNYRSVVFTTKQIYTVFMKKYYQIIKDNPLFAGIADAELENLLTCMSAKLKKYKKDDTIILADDIFSNIGFVLSGKIQICKEDEQGNRTILAVMNMGELFGEVFVCAGVTKSPVTIFAVWDCEILFLDYKKLVTMCQHACGYHVRLIENMLKIIAQKALMLNQKIEILSKRTTRDKILCFFDLQRGSAKKLTIPFNREEMADYLCVDRSALSAELAKMRKQGMIAFNKNRFEIKN